ncbi:T9SS type A sorting domain-containing protein [Saprospiraceae bacterium]|nr:T9SS type A sorting domain-containing protein [Saprospiraceae bacterium]
MMIKTFLTVVKRNQFLIWIFLLLGMQSLDAQISYKCGCDDALDNDVIEFRITIEGATVNANETWTLSSASNLFLSLNPMIPVPNGFVVPPTAADPAVYEVTGFAFNNVMPFVTVTGPNGMPVDVNMITCMKPFAELIVDGGTDVCAGATIDLSVAVTLGNIIPTTVDNSTIVFTAPGSSSVMTNADGTGTVAFNNSGSFLVGVSGETFAGCEFSGEMVLTVTDASEGVEIMGADLLCTANVTDIPYSVSNPDDLSIEWTASSPAVTFDPSGVTPMTGSGSSVDVTFPAIEGTITLTVSNSDPNGCAINGVSKDVTIVETIDTVGIIGSTFICLGESENYTIADASTYSGLQWTVSPTTGATITPMSGASDLIRLTVSQPGDYDLTVTGTSADGCPIESTITVTGADNVSASIACNNTVNVSLNNNCTLMIEADVILEGENLNNDAFTLEVLDETTGEVLTTNMITQDQLGHTFVVTVNQKCGGNSCWGNLVVEDKSITPLAPFCSDSPAFTTCFNFEDTDNPPGFPDFDADVTVTFRESTMDYLLEGFDNCSDAILTVSDENTSSGPCEDPQTIERTWTVTDINNGATSTCEVEVLVSLVDGSSIIWPPNFDTVLDAENGDATAMDTDNTFGSLDPCNTVGNPAAIDNPSLLCGLQWIPLEDGNPSPECTGFPTGLLCTNLQLIGFKDESLPICGMSRKILRRWTVWDACANEQIMFTQIITIMDTRIPICSAPIETQAFTEVHECGATVFLDPPLIAGECEETSYTVTYKLRDERGLIPDQFSDDIVEFDVQANKFKLVDLPFDSDTVWINYIVTDVCGNRTISCFNEIELIDDEQPIPACDLNTSVTLNDEGCAFATPGSFDDHSWDNCGIFSTVVQKMDTRCDCELSRFDFLDYLGTTGGKFYYLSKDKVHAGKAFALAASIDGHAATINSAAENTWIREQVNRFQPGELYTIGLNGTDNGGAVVQSSLMWQSGTSAYRNWATSEPVIDKNITARGNVHTYVNPDGTWDAERRNFIETYYVVERDEMCGWTQKVKFCCADVGVETMVALRVIDNFGNHNQCMVRVDVRDIIGPVITCPADVTIDCDEDVSIVTSQPTVTDLCGGLDITEVVGDDTYECGDDFVLINRTFSVTDVGGNRNSCTQVIRKENLDPFSAMDIRFPADHTFTNDRCTLEDLDPEDLPAGRREPIINANSCSQVVFTFDDLLFTIVDGYCQKLVRTWTVVDWCQPDRVFTHDQVIKLTNTIAPEISPASCATMTIAEGDGTLVGECMVQVDGLIAELDEVNNNCSETITFTYSVILNGSTGTPDRTGTGNDASGVFPYGTHTITYTAVDACDNEDTCTKTLIVNDNKAPTPYCLGEVVLPLSTDGTIEVWADDFDLGSEDDCPDGNVTASFSGTSIVRNMTFDCDDLNPGSNIGNVSVEVFFLDDSGNAAFCTVDIILQDNRNTCDNVGTGTKVAISGQIMTENFEMIDQVEVSIMSGDINFPQMNMAQMGDYAFTDLDAFQDYMVEPSKDIDYLNGVSTLDLVMIQRHILGSVLLDSPYKVIAADIDNSESITAIDLIELRKLILGIYDEFPKNDSWRFVDAGHIFTDVHSPFPYPESIDYQNLDHDALLSNFMGVKIGDVNGSVQANAQSVAIDKRSGQAYGIILQDANTDKGNRRLQAVADQDIDLAGLQMTMQIADNNQDIMAVIPMALEIANDNVAWDKLADGQLVLSWNSLDVKQVREGEILFEILLSGQGSATAQLLDGPLRSEVYESNGNDIEVRNINLIDNTNQLSGFEFSVNQNVPNPFKDESVIEFMLPADSEVVFSVTDQNGRVVYTNTQIYSAGNNQIIVQADEMNVSGVLYYQLSTDKFTSTKRMIVIR